MAAIDLRARRAGRRSVAAAVLAAVPGHHRDQPPAVLDGAGRVHGGRRLLRPLRRRRGLRERRVQGRGAVARGRGDGAASRGRRRAAAPRRAAARNVERHVDTLLRPGRGAGRRAASRASVPGVAHRRRSSGPAGRSAGGTQAVLAPQVARLDVRAVPGRRDLRDRGHADGTAAQIRGAGGHWAGHTWNRGPQRAAASATEARSADDDVPGRIAARGQRSQKDSSTSEQAEHDRPGRCRLRALRSGASPSLPDAARGTEREDRRGEGCEACTPRRAATRVPRDGGHAPADARGRRPRAPSSSGIPDPVRAKSWCPDVNCNKHAPVAQLDRAPAF